MSSTIPCTEDKETYFWENQDQNDFVEVIQSSEMMPNVSRMKSMASKRQKCWLRHSFLQIRWSGPWGIFSTFSHSRTVVPILRSPECVVSTRLLISAGALGSGSTGPLWHGMVSSAMSFLGKLWYSLDNTATSSGKPNPLKTCITKQIKLDVLLPQCQKTLKL